MNSTPFYILGEEIKHFLLDLLNLREIRQNTATLFFSYEAHSQWRLIFNWSIFSRKRQNTTEKVVENFQNREVWTVL